MSHSQISKYQVYREELDTTTYSGNYLDRNNMLLLNQRSQVRPYADLTYLVRQSGNQGYLAMTRRQSQYKTPLMNWFEGTKNIEYVDERYIRWKLYGDGRYKPYLLENVESSSTPGIQHTPFSIKLDYGGFRRGDIIAPDKNKRHQVVIDSPAQHEGTGYIYRVKYIAADGEGNADMFFPVKYLKEGNYWIHMGNAYGEATKDEGGIMFGHGMSYVEQQINLHKSRWKFDVTDEAHRLRVGVAPVDKMGRPDYDKAFDISAAEVEFMNEIEWQKELWTFYGTQSNALIDQSTGYERFIGPGLTSFLEDGNVRKYSPETDSIRKIENILTQIWFDRVAPGDRNVIIFGGERFLAVFDRMVREEYAESATIQGIDFVLKNSKSFSADQKGYGFPANQFTEYYIRPFGKITVGHLPILDSTILTSVTYKGYPITSYEGIAFDIGVGNSRNASNIKLIKRRNSDAYYYSAGAFTPYGYRDVDNTRANSVPYHSDHGDYYTLHYRCEWAVWMGDVQRSLWIKPNVSC